MKQKILEIILRRIRKNAEHGAGLASEKGMFESPVPKRLHSPKDNGK